MIRHVILISIDNLRYDCIGYQPDKRELIKYDCLKYLETPTLNGIAEKGVCFTHAISTNTYTTASHASILTGLYPPKHGVRAFYNNKLNSDVITLAEVFKKNGYITILFTDTEHLFIPLDLNRGFTHLFVRNDKELFSFLSTIKEEKYFLFVHFFDVHAPFLFSEYEIYDGYNHDYYETMEKIYQDLGLQSRFFRDKPYDLWNNLFRNQSGSNNPGIEKPKVEPSIEFLLPLFVRGTSKFDKGRFKEFFKRLESINGFNHSIVTIFSDHGEGRILLMESRFFSHAGALYDNVIRIPVIFYHPDIKPEIVDRQISSVDIFPTIIDVALGMNPREVIPYQLDGKSLFDDTFTTAYCETWRARNNNDIFQQDCFLWQRAIRTGKKKYILYGKPEEFIGDSIFDLNNEEFIKRIYRELLCTFEDEQQFGRYIETLISRKNTKENILNQFLNVYKKQTRKYEIYDLENDPYEENPIDPASDPCLMLEYFYYMSKILSIQEGVNIKPIIYSSVNVIDIGSMIKNSLDGSLEEKEHKSVEIIKEALQRFGKESIATTFTGGKDSTVLLHLIRKAFNGVVPFRVFNIDTSFKFKEVYEFRDQLAQMWNLYLIILKNEAALKTINMAEDKEKCCHLLKTEPLNQGIKKYGIAALMTAIRWDEQEERKGEEYFSQKEGHVRVNPILHFTEKDIWEYIKKYDVPYCSLYKRGYRSLGCEPCTKPSEPGGPERGGRDQDKEEIMKRLREWGYF